MKKGFILGIIALIIILPAAWYLLSPIFNVVEVNERSPIEKDMESAMEDTKDEVINKEETMPSSASVIAQGNFKEQAHEVEGRALLIDTDDQQIVRFEDFNTINGPELRIYLATDTDADDFIDLGLIKATKGNVNYDIPKGTDTDKYNKVLVWCKPFKILFSYAELV